MATRYDNAGFQRTVLMSDRLARLLDDLEEEVIRLENDKYLINDIGIYNDTKHYWGTIYYS